MSLIIKKLGVGAVCLSAACLAAAIILLYLFPQDSSATLGRVAGSPSSKFSDLICSAKGATSSRPFVPKGAFPNSSTDSTQAIQRAIDAASSAGGGVVFLPPRTFLLDGHLILKSNVVLTGMGPATVLKAGPGFLDSTGPNGGYPIITTSGASNVTIANLTADQSGNVLDDRNIIGRLSAYLIDIRDSHNAVVENVNTRNPFTYSIAVVKSSNFCIARNSTLVTSSGRYDSLDGIHILDSNTGQVIDNHVDQRVGTDGDDGLVAHTINAAVYDVLYAKNKVRGGAHGDGMQVAVGKHPVYDITIRANDFYGSPFGIRTGYYATNDKGAVHNVTITGNYIHDLVPGIAFPDEGNAVDIGDFGAVAPVTYITVTNNYTCHAGAVIVVQGTGNEVSDNSAC